MIRIAFALLLLAAGGRTASSAPADEVPRELREAVNVFYRYLVQTAAVTSGDDGVEKHSYRRPIDYLRQVIPALQAILSGSRDPAPASDPGLDFDDAAELRLLLESLGGKGP